MSVASNGWRRPAVVCPRRQIYADLDRHRQDSQIEAWRARFARERNSRRNWQGLVLGGEHLIAREKHISLREARGLMRQEALSDEVNDKLIKDVVVADRTLDQVSWQRNELPANPPEVKSEGFLSGMNVDE